MSLLAAFLAIVQDWRNVFPQQRTFPRGVRQALGSLVCLGRRCLTRIMDQRRPGSQLERGVLPPLPLPVGAARAVPSDPETSLGVLPATEVYWQRGAKQRPLRLIVIAPTPYRKNQGKKLYYRDPAYLFTTDLRSPPKQLLQIYFDRWQIEVNHREEKDTLGVGQAQLWNVTSVPKQPVLAVAAYSALLLASLQVFGAERGAAYAQLPQWRRTARRPSCLDLITLLRKEIAQQPTSLDQFDLQIANSDFVRAAAA